MEHELSRPYQSKLRNQQTEVTKTRIIEATWELLRELRPVDISYAQIAEKAGVSRPTVYRHFPTPDDLYLAVSDRVFGSVVDPEAYATVGSALAHVRKEFGMMQEDPAIFRAQFAVPTRSRVDSNAVIRGLLEPYAEGVPEEHKDAFFALMDLLVSPYAWDVMHANWGLDADRAFRAVLVGMEAIAAHMAENPDALDPRKTSPLEES